MEVLLKSHWNEASGFIKQPVYKSTLG
jgi:hypothetical protein